MASKILTGTAESWFECMRLGRYAEAWRISDRVLAARSRSEVDRAGTPPHERYVWTGADLAGKSVLVRCYHGLGDTIQFVRLTANLRAIGCSVAVQAQPELLPLLRSLPEIDRLIPLDWATPDPPHEVAVEVMELLHALRIMPADLPGRIPYLMPPAPRVVKRWAAVPHDGRMRIGLAWAAGSWDVRRSIAIDQLRPLATLRNAAFFSLQRGGAEALLADETELRFENPADRSMDLMDTAALIATLDLVIAVDSMVAHLTGAMGCPVWLLLHHEADWRWMAGRADSPWYPTMRLFRQSRPGDWATPVSQILALLKDGYGAAVG
ncbi:MAG: hypothetical protein JWM91_277 [Rhodospirillales bacterium]|nr:hypothetical protein [Rhodospirillales bacterium]